MRPYTVDIFIGREPRDLENGNVDVEVTFSDGRRYGATFVTPKNISQLMKSYEATGECAGGLYLWASDMVVIRDLSRPSIEECVAALLAADELESAFSRLNERVTTE